MGGGSVSICYDWADGLDLQKASRLVLCLMVRRVTDGGVMYGCTWLDSLSRNLALDCAENGKGYCW